MSDDNVIDFPESPPWWCAVCGSKRRIHIHNRDAWKPCRCGATAICSVPLARDTVIRSGDIIQWNSQFRVE